MRADSRVAGIAVKAGMYRKMITHICKSAPSASCIPPPIIACDQAILVTLRYRTGEYSPVNVNMMFNLNVSPSITCTPELFPVGEIFAVIAWIPWRVPARTRYSLGVSVGRPSIGKHTTTNIRLGRRDCDCRQAEQGRTSIIALIDKTSGFVDDPYTEDYHLDGSERLYEPSRSVWYRWGDEGLITE